MKNSTMIRKKKKTPEIHITSGTIRVTISIAMVRKSRNSRPEKAYVFSTSWMYVRFCPEPKDLLEHFSMKYATLTKRQIIFNVNTAA